MSLFWRIAAGFALISLITLLCQRLIYSSYSRIPTVQSWMISASNVVAQEGENAFESLNRHDANTAKRDLRALDESGIHSWLVTRKGIVGNGAPPKSAIERALAVLNHQDREGLYLGYRIRLVRDGSQFAVLLMVLPGLDSPLEVVSRLSILIGLPLIFCFLFARNIARPIEKVSKVASLLATGDVSARVVAPGGSSEVKLLGMAVNELACSLEESRSAQKRLLADLSHEIRSPLGRLLLASEMLEGGKGSAFKYHAQIRRDVERLNELVESLAYVIQPKKQPVLKEVIDLADIARLVLEATSIEAEQNGIQIISAFAKCEILGKSSSMYSAMENLVRNAILHAPSGTAIEFNVISSPPTVEVMDRGPGVPLEHLEEIFEPFFRYSDARERDTGGVGLGLAIVQAAMAEHKGVATASLREGGGLIVTLEFPEFGT